MDQPPNSLTGHRASVTARSRDRHRQPRGLGQVVNKSDNPVDLFVIGCDDEFAYQGRLRVNNADPEYYVNPQLLVTAAGVSA